MLLFRSLNSCLRFRLFSCCLLISMSLAPVSAPAQEEGAPPLLEEGAEEALSPATVNESLGEIQALRAAVDDDTQSAALQERLGQLQADMASVVEERLVETPIAEMGHGALEELLQAISRQIAQTERLQSEVTAAIGDVDALRELLNTYAQTWRSALADPELSELPQELAARVEQVVLEAQEAYAAAQARLAQLVEMEASTLALNKLLQERVAEAEERERTLQQRTFAIVDPPLWAAVSDLNAEIIRSDLVSAMRKVEQAVVDLAANYRGRLVIHAFAALVLLVAVLVIGRSSMLTSHDELALARQALVHPLAVSVLLILVLTPFLYPNAPPTVITLNSILFLLAELVVLAAVLPWLTALRACLMGVLLVLSLSLQLLPQDTLFFRVALFFLTIGAIAVFLAVRRVAASDPAFRSLRGRGLIQGIVVLFAVLLAAALVANAVGATGFATYAMEAVRRSGLAAIGLATLVLVISILVTLVIGSRPAGHLRSISSNRDVLTSNLNRAIAWGGVFLWCWDALIAFRISRPVLELGSGILNTSFEVGDLTIVPASIVFFFFAIWLAFYVSRLTRFFLEEDILPRLSLPRGVPALISTSLHYSILTGAFLIGAAAIGFDMSNLAIVAGALSVGIGFGLQNIVSNFVSGLILLFERPIHVGDNVQAGPLMGVVKRIGVRASVIRTYEGSEVIVPNGDLISQQVTNFTLSDRKRRLEVIVGVAYKTDLDEAKTVIESAVRSVENVLIDPAPLILFQSFGDSSLDFRVLFWVPDFDVSLGTASDVGMAIRRALNKAGIEIPFPQRDVHLHSAEPGENGMEEGARAPDVEAPRLREVEGLEDDE